MTTSTVLQLGQKINIVKVDYDINVVVTGTQTKEEAIPFGTAYQDDSSLDKGKTQTITEGKDGLKDVTYDFVSQNGKISKRTVTGENIKEQPVNQVVAQGTKTAPQSYYGSSYGNSVTVVASRGVGNVGGMSWPLSGSFLSGFGPRWGRLHKGIDILGKTGQTYYAAQSGTVIFAGWDGSGYGNTIVIDHGNGVQTRYAHSSGFLVGVGAQVSRGQAIGLVGSTGNAKGPHLHFEVIVNGSQVNPLGYL